MDEKTVSPVTILQDGETELEHGHMQELEVNVARVLKEDGLEGIEGDQSPYPEGLSAPPFLRSSHTQIICD